jgi:Domain of unknown function (DUF5615)
MARLYADENFDYPIVEELRRLGHDVLTAQEAGQGGQKIPDPAVLAYATAAGRAVLTLNHRDFKRLYRQGVPHAGIVSCTRDDDSAALAGRIHAAVSALPVLANQFVRITKLP